MIMHIPPCCSGQIIEVSYGCDCNGNVFKRVLDRSDGTVDWYTSSNDYEYSEHDCWEPWNAIPTGYHWQSCLEPKY
jgi:hypothetical protein